MNNNLGMIGLILMALLTIAVVGLFSAKIGSTTPIDKPNNPPPPDDLCWYVEYCPNERIVSSSRASGLIVYQKE